MTESRKHNNPFRSDSVYQTIFEGASEGILVAELNSKKFIMANDAICEMLGRTKDELLQLSVFDIHPKDSLEAVIEAFKTIARGDCSLVEGIPCLTKTGEIFHANVSCTTVFLNDVACAVGYFADISESRKVKKKLEESEQRYRTLFTRSPIAIWEEDFSIAKKHTDEIIRSGIGDLREYLKDNPAELITLAAKIKIVDANESALKTFNVRDTNEFINKYPEFFCEETMPAFIEFIDDIVRGRSVSEKGLEVVAQSVDGERLTLDLSWSVAPDRERDFSRIWFYAVNITKRKQAEQELRQHKTDLENAIKKRTEKLINSEQQYRRLAENLPDIIMHWVPGQGLVYVNDAFERILGYDKNRAIHNWGFFISRVHPDDIKVIGEAFQEVGINRKDHQTVTYRFIREDGSIVWLEVVWKPLWGDDGTLHAVEAIARDVTERKEAEKQQEELRRQLIHAQKMEAIGTLAGGMAHDFNNILATISGTTEILMKQTHASASSFPKLERILNSSNRAKELTMKLLTFARKEKLNVETTGLNRIVRDVLDMMKGTISKNINIYTQLTEGVGNVTVDSNQIIQALLNICINACDAMPQGGELIVETRPALKDDTALLNSDDASDNLLVVSISDTGEGISRETRSRIFEPFFTTKESGKGSGLGLSISHGIIKSHNGFISVQSEAGAGTIFKIFLPASELELTTAEDENGNGRIAAPKCGILVVDDDRDFMEMSLEALSMEGFTVHTASSGRDAVDLYQRKKHKIDVVILDMILPEMDGLEIFRELKAINPEVSVVLCSGYSIEGRATLLLKEGAEAFLQKPFTFNEMLDIISKILAVKSY